LLSHVALFLLVVRQHNTGGLGGAEAAGEARPPVNHAAAALAAAEIRGQIVGRGVVVVRQVVLGQQVQPSAAQSAARADEGDGFDRQTETAGDFGVPGSGAKHPANDGQFGKGEEGHGNSGFKI
jgi:hypothetical protein